MKKIIIALTVLLFCVATKAQTFTPTDAGSKVHFVIKNFGIKTGGDFTGLAGSIIFNPKALNTSKFIVTVNAATINTDNSTRDKHLKKSEYFDVTKYPLISFTSTQIIESTSAGRFYVVGNLTIKNITKVVQFGFSADFKDNSYFFKGGFDINRKDFGVGGSSMSMSDNLTISLEIVANK